MSHTTEKDDLQDGWREMDDDAAFRNSHKHIPGCWEANRFGQNLAQHIRDLYDSGAKMWTKEMFIDIENELSKDPLPTHVLIPTMDNEFHQVKTPEGIGLLDDKNENKRRCVCIDFNMYQMMLYHTRYFLAGQDISECSESYLEQCYNEDKASYTSTLAIGLEHEQISCNEYSRLRAVWDETRQNWTQSVTCNELISILKTRITIPTAVNKLVCFGLGNPDEDFDTVDNGFATEGRRRMAQHAAALTMATVFGELLGTSPVPVLVQDPAYTPMAKSLLRELGFEVVGGHGSLAFTHVDDDTVVFTCAPNIPVKQVVADIAKPAAMIWDSKMPDNEERKWRSRMENGVEMIISPWTTNDDTPRTRKLVENYDMFQFPEDAEIFGDLEIYIRRD